MTAGHFAVVASRGIIADNMISWGILAPVRQYTSLRPDVSLYYTHHPWGTFWLIAGLTKVLGRHEAVIRLMPIVMTSANALLLFGLGRALYGAIAGALASLSYAALPIVLAFSNFPGFEVPTVFGCLLAAWGYVHMVRTWQRRWMAVSVIGFAWSFHADWNGFVFAAVVLGAVAVMLLFSRTGQLEAVQRRRLAEWWALTVASAAVTLAFYLLLFARTGLIQDLIGSYHVRAAGGERTLREMLQARSYWIDVMFTPVAVTVGKLAVPVILARLVLRKNLLEVFPLALLAMALVHYLLFPNGADVHIYWPMPFAPYFALAVAALFRSLAEGLAWVWRKSPRAPVRAQALATGAFLALPLAILPDGLIGLDYARMTGGRLNDDGHVNFQDTDKAAALDWLRPRLLPQYPVRLHTSMNPTWAEEWILKRPTRPIHVMPARSTRKNAEYFVADSGFVSSEELVILATEHAVTTIGPFWFVDTGQAAAPIQAYRFVEREPNGWERYVISGHDPMRTVKRDPFVTWELRHHLRQLPNPIPEQAVASDNLRIAHNIAVARHQPDRAARLRQQLVGSLDRRPATEYTDGTRLLGIRYVPGVAPKLCVYFLAATPSRFELVYGIRSTIEAKPWYSLVPADDKAKHVGTRFTIGPRLWQPGFIYELTSEIRHRPGREAFYGYWLSQEQAEVPRPRRGPLRTLLLTLP